MNAEYSKRSDTGPGYLPRGSTESRGNHASLSPVRNLLLGDLQGKGTLLPMTVMGWCVML